jgi:hypothetical protein
MAYCRSCGSELTVALLDDEETCPQCEKSDDEIGKDESTSIQSNNDVQDNSSGIKIGIVLLIIAGISWMQYENSLCGIFGSFDDDCSFWNMMNVMLVLLGGISLLVGLSSQKKK